jgi:hypothetical protein
MNGFQKRFTACIYRKMFAPPSAMRPGLFSGRAANGRALMAMEA